MSNLFVAKLRKLGPSVAAIFNNSICGSLSNLNRNLLLSGTRPRECDIFELDLIKPFGCIDQFRWRLSRKIVIEFPKRSQIRHSSWRSVYGASQLIKFLYGSYKVPFGRISRYKAAPNRKSLAISVLLSGERFSDGKG